MRPSNAYKLVFLVLAVAALGLSCGDDNKVPGLPIADAGFNRTVVANVEARLDGTASADPDGKPLTYAWTIVSKPANSTAVFAPATAEPAITPDLGGNYLFSLVVNNGERDSRPAAVALLVLGGSQNTAPVATAVCAPADCKVKHGTTTPTTSGSIFRLDGRGSYDPNSDAMTYEWTQITNAANCGLCTDVGFVCDPTVTVTASFPNATYDSTKALAEILAPMAVGIMIFRLEVKDTGALVDSTCLRVESTNNPPPVTIDTPSSLTVREGVTIALNGSGSTDEDSVDTETYQWTHSPPSVPVVYSPNATSASVTATVSGITEDTDVTFTLTVSDSFATSSVCARNTETCGRLCCGEVAMHIVNTLPVGDTCSLNTECASSTCTCTDATCTAGNKKCAPAACVCKIDSNFDGVCDGNLNGGTQPEGCSGTNSCTGGTCS